MGAALKELREISWALVALAGYCLFLLDGLLTMRVGYEASPWLAALFSHDPGFVVILKMGFMPLFWGLGWYAVHRKSLVTRYGLLIILGWYAATAVIELAQFQ